MSLNEQQVFGEVVTILTPYVKNVEALKGVSPKTNILQDLEVNSARLVDVVLAIEEQFNIEVADEEADSVVTVGDTVDLVMQKAV